MISCVPFLIVKGFASMEWHIWKNGIYGIVSIYGMVPGTYGRMVSIMSSIYIKDKKVMNENVVLFGWEMTNKEYLF